MQPTHVLWIRVEWGMGRNSALLNDNIPKNHQWLITF